MPRKSKANKNSGPMKVSTLRTMARAPAAQNRSSRQSGRNTLRFRECERVATINGSVAFANSQSVICNPGLSASFPWLAGHANLFENYRVKSLTYRFKNLKGTSSDGNILLSFDYDTLDDAPSSAIQATQSTHYVDGAPWRIFSLKVPTDNRTLFTRAGAISASNDLKTYDMGALHVSTEGCADTSPHGYLEVEYDIELFNKQASAPSVSPGLTQFRVAAGPSLVPVASVIPWIAPTFDGIGLTQAAGVITLPIGTYMVTLVLRVSLTVVNALCTYRLNGVAVDNNDGGFSIAAQVVGAQDTSTTSVAVINVTAPSTLDFVILNGAMTVEGKGTAVVIQRV